MAVDEHCGDNCPPYNDLALIDIPTLLFITASSSSGIAKREPAASQENITRQVGREVIFGVVRLDEWTGKLGSPLVREGERRREDGKKRKESSGSPRTRVMGDEECTVIRFGKSQWGGGEEDQ
ncbi:hypothetical protein EYF80_026614 [Liparis tanakae]|uniref:Uncharacterized protein n=1 Tax=Liparis tanakae TaxID=230148 RepID=A0A4Z2HCA4_9TELE|nr:hypothetical protein EYF80_026614 [Liparis tanakae]